MQPKKILTRKHENSKLLGVCAGIADYLDMDVTVVRILFVLFSMVCGCIIIPYLILALIMPHDENCKK